MKKNVIELILQSIGSFKPNPRRQRQSGRSAQSNSLQFSQLEHRQLLAATEIAFWEFSDSTGTVFKDAAITGTQASDIQWRFGGPGFSTNEGLLNVFDDGSNQFFTDLQQKSNTANLDPLDLSGKTRLRLQVSYGSWDLSNATEGTVQRFDLKRQGGTTYAIIRLNKTSGGANIQLMFNNTYTSVPMPMINGDVNVFLDLDLAANSASYHVGASSGMITPTNAPISLGNETLNFGVTNNFLGSTFSLDSVNIDSMGLSAIPEVTRSIQTGNWTDVNTWDNGLPSISSRAIIGQGTTVTLNGANHVAESIVVHGNFDVAEDGNNRSLLSNWIHVNSGGVFQIGTAADRFDNGEFTMTLTGDTVTADHVIETATGSVVVTNNDGFLMSGVNGQLQFFGEDKVTFTKLGATAEAGANTITVERVIERNFDGTTSTTSDGLVDWQIGDEIVVASSSRDYSQEDVRTITAISNTASQSVLTLDSALNFRHYGEIETYDNGTRTWDIDLRAEVALLNRSISIQGTQDTDVAFGDRANFGTGSGENLGIGAHAMIMNGSGQITVDGVRFDKMGQTGQLGRYPIHWHLAGDRTGDVMRNSSVTNSNNRGTTVHGTHGLLLEGNVFHDIHGHGFFMEDGVETDNQYLNNIVLGVHRVGGDNSALSDPFIVDTHDVVFQDDRKELSSAAYWITNPDNTWVGNISAGSEGTGFWFVLPTGPIGASKDNPTYAGVNASTTDLKSFDHNSSHTAPLGLVVDRGADIEIKIGDPIFPGNGAPAGRYYPTTPLLIENFTAYKHDGAAVYTNVFEGYTFDEIKYADNFLNSFQLRAKTNSNSLYVGNSRGNADLNEVVSGHTLYNGAVLLKDNHFAGLNAANAYFFSAESATKRQHYLMEGSTFEADGTLDQIRFDNPAGNALTNRQLPLAGIDIDGSLTGHVGGGPGYTIIPNHPFFQDADDVVPAGWDSLLTDDYYATLQLTSAQSLAGPIVETRITNPVGVSLTMTAGQNQMAAGIKLGWGDYTVEFPQGLGTFATDGFDFVLRMYAGDEYVPAEDKAAVLKFIGVGAELAPRDVAFSTDLAEVRSATETSYTVDANGDVWMKVFYDQGIDFGGDIKFKPVMKVDLDPSTISEDGGTVVGTLTRPVGTTNAMAISLVSSDPSSATVPASVTIPNGQDSVEFTIIIVDDVVADGNQALTITASNPNFADAFGSLEVIDNDVASIVSRSVSYGGATADFGESATDPTKQALLPGEAATFANYTSYFRGLNRLVIEANGFPSNTLTANDFEFRVGDTDTPSDWLLLTDTSSIPLPTISVTSTGAGASNILLTWPDNAIENNWLQVNLLANTSTGLTNQETFYFGNAIAEAGNDPTNTRVNLFDLAYTRLNQTGFGSADVDNPYDFNRDGRVNLVDIAIVRINQTGFSSLVLFTAPGGGSLRAGNSFAGNYGFDGSTTGLLGQNSWFATSANVPENHLTDLHQWRISGERTRLISNSLIGVTHTANQTKTIDAKPFGKFVRETGHDTQRLNEKDNFFGSRLAKQAFDSDFEIHRRFK